MKTLNELVFNNTAKARKAILEALPVLPVHLRLEVLLEAQRRGIRFFPTDAAAIAVVDFAEYNKLTRATYRGVLSALIEVRFALGMDAGLMDSEGRP